ncbi:MAG TPA: radical SAM protein [Syntrophales bacterium]|nr:radical SAM protein [Syntrophales bacterium]HQN79221.1 radical SAM protein [Syntrophales bacterium]
MGIRENDRESIIEGNRRDLGPLHDELSWVRPEKAEAALEERSRLLRALAPHVETGFRGTKLDCRTLSPGCRLCGEGAWSCLFINGICNGGCFYCPSEQKVRGEPMTGGVRFSAPREYLSYLERFGFRGVSISGGEPLLTPDRTLLFLEKIRDRFGAGMYVWLYTNGLLADRDTLCHLRDIGIDEIRFNIGAVNYRLDPVLRAVGIIPRVTVEVPAVPEKEGLLKEAAREMARSGVDFLNLHQIRCTPHNGRHLAARGYTLLHGPRISVLESELAALRILADLRERGIGLPVNYCSCIYRSRFQGAGAARRAAGIVRKPWEDITEAGRIRSLFLEGPPETLRRISETLPREGASGGSRTLAPGGGRLLFSGEFLSSVAASGVRAGVSYFACSLHPSLTYGNPCTEVPLTRKKSVFVERRALVRDLPLLPGDLSGFERWFVRREDPPRDAEELLRRNREEGVEPGTGERERWERVFEGECIPFGPADYY